MIYTYSDKYLVNSVSAEELEAEELKAYQAVSEIGITADPYLELLVRYSLYMELALMQLESEGMQEKYDGYSKEFSRYFNMAKTATPTNVSNIPLNRG